MDFPIFKDEKLLILALTHRSYLNEVKKDRLSSNERLEFLGDAILSFFTSLYLYKNYPHYTEGQLTNLRANLVKTPTLAKIARELKIGERIRLSKGEENTKGRENPSILADTFESLLAAFFLDQGLEKIEEFISQTVFPLIPQILEKGSLKDYKSLLQEKTQEKYHSSPQYLVEEEFGPDHAKTFIIGVYVNGTLLGKGTGSSKQRGEQVAAKVALEKVKSGLLK